jgi:hypothetical protein
MHASADARLIEKVHGDLFDYAGANAAEHMIGGLPFQNDVIDAVFVKELTEQKARGAGADDDDLPSHILKLGLFDQGVVRLSALERVVSGYLS